MPPKKTSTRGGRGGAAAPPQTPTPATRTPANRGRGTTPSRGAAIPPTPSRTIGRRTGERPQYLGIGNHGQPLSYQSPNAGRGRGQAQAQNQSSHQPSAPTLQSVAEASESSEDGSPSDSSEESDHADKPKYSASVEEESEDENGEEDEDEDEDEDASEVGSDEPESEAKPVSESERESGSESELESEAIQSPRHTSPPAHDPLRHSSFSGPRSGSLNNGARTPAGTPGPSTGRTPSAEARAQSVSSVVPSDASSPRHSSQESRRSNTGAKKPKPPGPPGPPANNGSTAPPRARPQSWWYYFKQEVVRALRHLHPWEWIWRWVIIFAFEFWLVKQILCSAGPICKTHRFTTIFWAYLWRDSWYMTFDFSARLILYTLLLLQLYDTMRGLYTFVLAMPNVTKRRAIYGLQHPLKDILLSICLQSWGILETYCDTALEPLILFILMLTFNGVTGNGDALVSCSFMLLMHLAKWIVEATDQWNQAWRFPLVPPNSFWVQSWRRLMRIAVSGVLIVAFLYYYRFPKPAHEWVNGGIRSQAPTPTEMNNPVFNVTKITSVTGDFTAALNSILSASGLSPITLG